VATATAHHYATVNPCTGEVVREFESLDAAAVETAHEAFGAWRARSIDERAAIVRRAGDLLAERRERLAAPNLVLGNTILLKHASTCPQSALALEDVFRDAGVPAGAFTNLFIETGDIAAVIESPRGVQALHVFHEHYDAFVSGLRDRFAALAPGDPADPATTLAPLSSERAASALMDQVEDAVAKGATVIVGGGRPDSPGAFVEATILTGVSPAMRAYNEELFGPVAVVHSVAGEDEAVALANDTPFGLGGSVFAADVDRAQRVAARLDSGMVWINRPAASRPELPFGGIKRSGYGRELGAAGIEEFANRKLICAVAPDAPVGGFAG
jgi:acyl-CoA reductase-like NAD-dependent aldehyde dehydrogenase